jgi:hypothetical protein
MFIVSGAYHFWPKRVAFRDDYCLTCQAPRRSIAVRTFDVGYIYWIPILPVGFWKHWKCTLCGRDPHASPKTRRSFKWAGLACLTIFTAASWAAPVEGDPESAVFHWVFRIAAPAGAILLFVHLLRAPADSSLREKLAAVQPAADAVCPFCNTPLVTGNSARWSCPGCRVVRY